MKFSIRRCFKNTSRKFKCNYHSIRITDTLHEDLCTLLHSAQLVLEWEMILTKVVTNKTTHILGSIVPIF